METLDLINLSTRDSDRFIRENTGLIYMVVGRFKNRGVEADDLFQLAAMGLLKAMKNFDHSLGLQFSTYAVPMMMGEIRRHLRDTGPIKVSRSYKTLASKAAALREQLVKEKGGRTHITKKYSTQNKETKIIVNSSWVKEHVYFKDTSEYEPKSDYGMFMANVCNYTQLGKNAHDDGADMLAMFALFVSDLYGSQVEVVKRTELGF